MGSNTESVASYSGYNLGTYSLYLALAIVTAAQ